MGVGRDHGVMVIARLAGSSGLARVFARWRTTALARAVFLMGRG